MKIYVDSQNKYFKAEDSVLFHMEDGVCTLVKYPGGKTNKSYSVPDGVDQLAWSSFENKYLESCIISDGVEALNAGVFFGCTALKTVTIPSTVKLVWWNSFSSDSLTDIYYEGSEEEWNNITVKWSTEDGIDEGTISNLPTDMNFLSDVTVHFANTNTTYFPVDINEVTINGRGTAYGWFKAVDSDGRAVKNTAVKYTIDGGKSYSTTTDSSGYACVTIENVTKSKDYTIRITGNGVRSSEGVLSVTVKPLEFTSNYTAKITKGASAGLAAGVEGSIGKLEAEAELASVTLDGSNSKSLSLSQGKSNNKTKLTVTATENADAALSAKVGLFAGAKAELAEAKASVGDVHGKVKYGNGVSATFEDDDFNINDSGDVWDLSKFLLSVWIENMDSNVATRYLVDMLDAPVSSYSNNMTVSLAAGASVGVIEASAGDVGVGTTLAGLDGSAVFGYSNGGDSDNNTTYQSSMQTSAEYKLLDTSIKTKSQGVGYKSGTSVFSSNLGGNNISLSAMKNSDDEVQSVSLTSEKNKDKSIFWAKNSQTDKQIFTYKNDAAQTVSKKDQNLYNFVNGNKYFFSPSQLSAVAKQMVNSQQRAEYTKTKEIERGVDADLSASLALLLKLGGKVGMSGIEGYDYETVSGIYENDTIYKQSKADVDSLVKNEFIGVEDLIVYTAKPISNFISTCWNVTSDAVNGIIEAGQATVGSISDWTVSIFSPTSKVGSMSILAVEDEFSLFSASSVATTIGEPYVIDVADEQGDEVTDLFENPITLTLSYTDEQLAEAGVTDVSEIQIYRWDDDKCVYIAMGGTLDEENKSLSLEITKPGQYILAVDNCPPAVTEFTASDSGKAPTISAFVSDMSGIVYFSFSIDGEEYVNTYNMNDYYDLSSSRFEFVVPEGLSEGEHTAEIDAIDYAGNILEEPAVITFTVDRTAPVIDSVSEFTGLSEGGFEMSAAVSGDDVSTVLLNVKEEDWNGNTSIISYEMVEEDGVYTAAAENIPDDVKVSAWVSAYNRNGNSAESDVQVLDLMPMIEITDAKNGTINVKTANGSGEVYIAVYEGNKNLKSVIKCDTETDFAIDTEFSSGDVIKAFMWKDNEPLTVSAEFDVE